MGSDMKKTIPTPFDATSNITDPISKEMAEQHVLLHMLYIRTTDALYMRKGRPGKGLQEEQEVARANLRAFERKNGLTPL